MRLDNFCSKRLIDIMASDFKTEIQYYAHPKVQTTAHAVGVSDTENWTQILYENKIIDMLPPKGDRFVEIERTLTALYCFFLLALDFETAYGLFVFAQRNDSEIKTNEIISKVCFKHLYDRATAIINGDLDTQTVLICLIIYSDLGKSPRIKELLTALSKETEININLSLNSDALMADIFHKLNDEQMIKILPSFSKLSKNAKDMLRNFFPIMRACFGHIYFLERGQETFNIIGAALQEIPLDQRKKALDIVYLAQLYDGIGAQGQRKITGSVTCTTNFYRGYDLFYTAFTKLQDSLNSTNNLDLASQIAFKYYLHERAKWLGFNDPTLSPEKEFITRLGCNLRGFTPDLGKILVEEFKKLHSSHQALLVEQLSFNRQGIERWTRVDYLATIPQNLSRKLIANGQIREAVAQALNGTVCFAMLAKEIATQFPSIVIDRSRSISFGEIAFFATEKPNLFNPSTFCASAYSLDLQQNKVVASPKKHNSWTKKTLVTGVGLAALYVGYSIFSKRIGASSSAPGLNPLTIKI